MKNRRIILAAAGALSAVLAFSLNVSAAVPDSEGPHGGVRSGHCPLEAEYHKQFVGHHLDELHDVLKLTSGQEAAWKTYRDAETARFDKQGVNRPRSEAPKELSTPDWLEQRLAALKRQQEDLSTMLADTRKFYEQLTPEQQKIFDRKSAPRYFLHDRDDHKTPPPPPLPPPQP